MLTSEPIEGCLADLHERLEAIRTELSLSPSVPVSPTLAFIRPLDYGQIFYELGDIQSELEQLGLRAAEEIADPRGNAARLNVDLEVSRLMALANTIRDEVYARFQYCASGGVLPVGGRGLSEGMAEALI